MTPLVSDAISESQATGKTVSLDVQADSLTYEDEQALYAACTDAQTNDSETLTLYTGPGWSVQVVGSA